MSVTQPTLVTSCPTCHGKRHQRLPTPGRWIGREIFERHRDAIGLARCTGCGLVFVNPRPNEQLLAAFYGGHTYECHRPSEAGWLRDKAKVVLERIQRHVPHARRVLDYGCGGGFLLRAARERGLIPVGLDIGTEARRACREQGFTVVADPSELEPQSFDAIVMHHVFEHMPEPRRALAGLSPLLSDGGKLLVEVPNVTSLRARLSAPWLSRRLGFDERHRAFPIHLWYFDPRTLSRLLTESGFAVMALETYGMGLDELFFREEEPTSSEASSSNGSRAKGLLPEKARRAIKRLLFERDLGENVLAVCARAAPARSTTETARAPA